MRLNLKRAIPPIAAQREMSLSCSRLFRVLFSENVPLIYKSAPSDTNALILLLNSAFDLSILWAAVLISAHCDVVNSAAQIHALTHRDRVSDIVAKAAQCAHLRAWKRPRAIHRRRNSLAQALRRHQALWETLACSDMLNLIASAMCTTFAWQFCIATGLSFARQAFFYCNARLYANKWTKYKSRSRSIRWAIISNYENYSFSMQIYFGRCHSVQWLAPDRPWHM